MIDINWATSQFGWICRGLVLYTHDWSVAAFGLPKFFNHGEGYAATIDWNTARVVEKLDGTMVNRWWSSAAQQWVCTTRYQLPTDVENNLVNNISWKDLFTKCFQGIDLAAQPKNETWVLEAMSLENQIVVPQFGYSGSLIAIRNNETLAEKLVSGMQFAPRSFDFASSEEVLEFAKTLSGREQEGFVVVDEVFNRIKIKGADYVYRHRVRDNLDSIKNLILLVRGNDYEEILVQFPEYQDKINTIAAKIEDVYQQHERAYENHKGIESQKDFALAIKPLKLPFEGALFMTRRGKHPSIRVAIRAALDENFVERIKELL
jgi:hypothetical protein